MHRVILFGLDGASYNVIQPWVEQGHLPAFARLMREGSRGVLKSTYPPVTVPAWAAMLTGKNPGRLGYHDFSERKEGSYHFGAVNLRWDEIGPVWKSASDQGKYVCVFNVPTTPVPSYPLNGIFVAGPGPLELGLGGRWARPERVDRLLRAVDYRKIMSLPVGISVPQMLAHLQHRAEIQCELATRFLREERWDLFMFCLFVTDLAGHLCLGNGDELSALLRIYQVADRWLGDLLDHLPEGCNLLVVSDHGQVASRWTVDLNSWLREQGYLVTEQGRRWWLSRHDIYRLVSRWGLFPLYKRLSAHRTLGRLDVALKKRIPWQRRLLEVTDWPRTRAYAISSGGIFVNRRGREPQGWVDEDEYDLSREKVIAALRTLVDPATGKPVVRQALRREEVYRGEFLEKMPDVVVEWEDGYSNLVSEGIPRCEVFSQSANQFHGGVHTRNGILMAWGPDIARGKDIGRARIVSVTPTLLYLLGLPVPAGLDGEVLAGVLRPESFSPVRMGPRAESGEYSEGDRAALEEAAILNRLRQLGYLD